MKILKTGGFTFNLKNGFIYHYDGSICGDFFEVPNRIKVRFYRWILLKNKSSFLLKQSKEHIKKLLSKTLFDGRW